MLSLIHVKNYAVIDEVELELGPGLSVVTGETGAGKSILVDALSLALGDRADAAVVRHGAERAEISVLFECPAGHPALAVLAELGLDDGETCALRRIVGQEGRSRAFINSQPVTLQDLKHVGSLLVDIHGQHAHQSLLQAGSQRTLLDAQAGLDELALDVAGQFRRWRDAEERLAAKRSGNADREARLELLKFQAAELEALALAPGEAAELEAERRRLANTDRLSAGLEVAVQALYEADSATAHALVSFAHRELEKLVDHDAALAEQAAQLAAAEIEIREAANALMRYRDRVEADPARLEAVETRLARARALARRHGVGEDDLPGVLASLTAEIDELESGEQSAEALERETAEAKKRYFASARERSAARRSAAARLGAAVTAQLGELGMPRGEFRIEVEAKPDERADATGLDRIEFQVRLNPGQPFGPLARLASGGELSRISLALEVVASDASPVPTLIFDEVDAGIGGGVAEIVGRKLAQLARDRQVLCVTHLPQVASQGERHYRVVKETDRKATRTLVRELDSKERVEELSRMLGGVEITQRTRAHAEEMIDRAAKARS
ncbi:MAG TPA: DNA repair protein RecN [Gammaproteobacteria bacterium]|nr:DNA repair protein RecN [Gammaproteobacteria bacterium]